MKKVLFIVGSTRQKSFNLQLAKEAEKIIQKIDDDVEIDYLEYFDLPFFNQDKEFPSPKEVFRVREQIDLCDGIWIFTPEYNQSYPGILKNLLDWLSRPLVQFDFGGKTSARGKRVTISGVSGKSATSRARQKLSELLMFIGMDLCCNLGEGFSADREVFQSDILKLSQEDKNRLENQAKSFLYPHEFVLV